MMNVKMTLNFQVVIILCCHFTSIEAQATSSSVAKHKQNISSKVLLNGTEINGEPHYSKMIGGKEALGSYEYLVSIQANGAHACSGALLSHYWVLTAAHCVTKVVHGTFIKYAAQIFEILVGSKQLFSPSSVRCLCEKVYLQPEYGPQSLNYDIALIKLKHSCPQKHYMTLANYKEFQKIKQFDNCKTLGWGSPASAKGYLTILLEIPAHFDDDDCMDNFDHDVLDAKSHLCTITKGVKVCLRDSGGPLLCNDKQVGIIINRGECDNQTDIPVVYLKIDQYLNWIHYMMSCSNSKIPYSVLCFTIILHILLTC